MSDETKALVPAATNNGTILPNSTTAAVAMFGGDESPIYCSFDLTTPAGKALLFRAAQGEAKNLMTNTGQVIELEHVYASYAEKVGEQPGEVIELTRIVLIDAGGAMWQCYSKGVKKAIRLLVAAYGLPPFKPPIRVKATLQQLPGPRNFLTLEPAPEEKPAGRAK